MRAVGLSPFSHNPICVDVREQGMHAGVGLAFEANESGHHVVIGLAEGGPAYNGGHITIGEDILSCKIRPVVTS